MDIKILVASHKKSWMPSDDMYLPIHVGKAKSNTEFGYVGDDTGENISVKNPVYCELTAIYWAWKNLKSEYIGLVHYGRMFSEKSAAWKTEEQRRELVLRRQSLEKYLSENDVLLPKKRNYYIESLYSHYAHTHGEEQLKITKSVIQEICPEYLNAFDVALGRKRGHMFNMFIMKKNYFDAYCQWLFPILEAVESKVDMTRMSAFEKRFVGRLSELLLNVWIEKNDIAYRELSWIYMRKVNYIEKIKGFLTSKIFHKKYKASF